MIDRFDHNSIRHLRMNRPPANALNPELIAALLEAVRKAPEEGAEAVVLSGSPGIFSGGLDVPHLLTLDRPAMAETWQSFFALLRAIATSEIPVVAAITGHSPAGGAVLSIYCDYRVMAKGNFKIGLNEVQVGLPLPPVIHGALKLIVGHHQAARLGITGALIPADEAYRIGLVDELVDMEEVETRAIAWCTDLLKLPPTARTRTRDLARHSLIDLFGNDLLVNVESALDDWFSQETRAGMQALVDRLARKAAEKAAAKAG